jgi:anti-sigma B factor antagonist
VRAVDDDTGVPAAEQVMTIVSARRGEAVVVTVAGEVDELTVDRLHTAVVAAFEAAGSGPVVVDLTEVSFLGSAGLGALVDAQRLAHRRREPLRVVVDEHRPVIRPLEASGVDRFLALYYDVDEALAAGAGGETERDLT